MRDIVASGKSIIMISSEIEEIVGLCNRVLIMRDNKIVAQIENEEDITKESIMKYAIKGGI